MSPPPEGRGMPWQGAPSVYFFKSISYIHAPSIYFFKSRKYIQAEHRRGRRGRRGSAIAHPECPPDAASWDKSTACPVRDAWDWVLTRSSAPSTTAGYPVLRPRAGCPCPVRTARPPTTGPRSPALLMSGTQLPVPSILHPVLHPGGPRYRQVPLCARRWRRPGEGGGGGRTGAAGKRG